MSFPRSTTAINDRIRTTQRQVWLLGAYWLFLLIITHVPLNLVTVEKHVPSIWLWSGGIQLDKMAHLLAYAGLGWLISLNVGRILFSFENKIIRVFFFVLLCFGIGCYGLLDEVTQPWFYREMDFWDWVMDLLGGTSGLFLGLVFVRIPPPLVKRS